MVLFQRWWSWTWAHRLTAAIFLGLLLWGGHASSSWIIGAATAVRWFSLIPAMDPLAALEMLLAARHFTGTVLCGLALTLLITLCLGRVFCGWLCPLGLLLELNAWLVDKVRPWLRQRGIPWPRFTLAKKWKYWLLGICLALTIVTSLPVFTTFSPINLLVLALLAPPGAGLIVPGLLWGLELFSPRVFCRALCPLGAFLSLLGHFAFLRVRINANPCLACQECSASCPMGIEVMENYVLAGRPTIADPECTRCGTCTDVCLGTLLQLGLRGILGGEAIALCAASSEKRQIG